LSARPPVVVSGFPNSTPIRNFPFGEQHYVSFRWEMFNALNRANFGDPNAAIGKRVAGQISSTVAARIMQFGLKVIF
jgi:hypothetical protein